MSKNSKNTKKNLKENIDVCYFCKEPLTNYNDWCYIEKEGIKTKAHYKCIAEHQF